MHTLDGLALSNVHTNESCLSVRGYNTNKSARLDFLVAAVCATKTIFRNRTFSIFLMSHIMVCAKSVQQNSFVIVVWASSCTFEWLLLIDLHKSSSANFNIDFSHVTRTNRAKSSATFFVDLELVCLHKPTPALNSFTLRRTNLIKTCLFFLQINRLDTRLLKPNYLVI